MVRFDLLIERTNLKWTIKVKSVSIVGGAGGVVVVLMSGTTLSREMSAGEC